MSNILVEGFAAYGTGNGGGSGFTPLEAIAQAMLSGIWASRVDVGSGSWGIVQLPWDLANPDLYLFTDYANVSSGTSAWRRVLPAALPVSYWSFFLASSELPTNPTGRAIDFIDISNVIRCSLQVQTTGAIAVVDRVGTVLAVTAGPVVVAETAQHFEVKVDTDTNSVQIYVQGALVLNATGLAFTGAGDIAQFQVLFPSPGNSRGLQYMSHLIVRDPSGDFNNTFPVGERKVATLFVNSDDPAHQGWSAHPIHRFGNGVLDATIKDLSLVQQLCGVTTAANTHLDLDDGDFTIEGQFRFQQLPLGSNNSVLFGKWDEVNNKRSYQLYLGGPTLENGLLVFRTSTDGLNGTVVEKLKWAWKPDPGTWYEIAMVRASGELLLFIDGVLQGIPVADTDFYFAGSEIFALLTQTQGVAPLAGTLFQGWQDEFRISKGLARYTSNYAPHTAAFPRNGGDPNWGSVVWLSSWDLGVVADDGPLGLPLVALNGTAAVTPDDGDFFFQLLNQNQYPYDDNFIEAALIAASALLTYVALPVANGDVTVGTSAPATPAIYTFRTFVNMVSPFDVLLGATIADSVSNLVAAINASGGAGVIYGTGTTANLDVIAALEPTNQLLATAVVAGTVGNSITLACDDINGDWSSATLLGGLDIPPFSQYGFQRLPSDTSLVDSITIASRQWKTDTGVASTQISLVGPAAGVENGQTYPVTTTPTVIFDTFETDPDNPTGPLSPTAILLSKVRVNRLT
jgi:hypothetical protein